MPELGAIPIQELNARQIQSYYAKLFRETELKQTTVRKHHYLLNTALKLAVRQGIIVSNPIDRVDPPRPEETDISFYSPEQLGVLLKAAAGDRLEVIVYLGGGMMGLRRGEICGLKWENVDLEKKLLHIVEVRTAAGKGEVVKNPKSRSSKRSVSIPDAVLNALKREKVKQEKNKAFLAAGYIDKGLVAVHDDGKPYRPNYLSEIFTRFVE